MSTTGKTSERKAESVYNTAGYRTWTPPKAKFREQDVFGLFDILALGHQQLRAVQVKTNRAAGIKKWSTDAGHVEDVVDGVTAEMIVRYPDEGWRLLQPDGDGYTVVFDGREIDEMPATSLLDILSCQDEPV